MATNAGNPVFNSVTADLSQSTASGDGGKTSITVGQMVVNMDKLGNSVADATQAAGTAKTDAASALQAATDANSTVETLKTNTVTTAMANVANGYAQLDGATSLNVLGDWATFGSGSGTPIIQLKCSGNTQQIKGWTDGGTGIGYIAFNCAWGPNNTKGALTADGAGQCALGRADNYFDTAYLGSAVNVVSDQKDKVNVSELDTVNDTSHGLLAEALYDIPVKTFQLKASVTDKGADKARIHVGMIAQDVQQAIAAAGLDPAKYAMWTNTPVLKFVEVDSGEKYADGTPIMSVTSTPQLQEDGVTPLTQQMLRYDQIACALLAAQKAHITALESAMTALTARVAALETAAKAK